MERNSLLLSLVQPGGRQRFKGLEQVELAFGQVLHEAGKRIRHVYFPTDSLVSVLSQVKGLIPVELGIIGRDGMVGVCLALGAPNSGSRALVQGAGLALRASAEDFMNAFARRRAMRADIRGYSNDLANQFIETASCNRNHDTAQRMARWLLMMRDRMSAVRYALTQQYLGYMLGARRATVNEAAGKLQRAGLIRFVRGSIEIMDARGLVAASCGCYHAWKPAS
jgi:CRP-like cAMP-binding protein